jgi:BirA family biotin operon repressor/biotin-[acetyl-CoA-carboxylase] ligase
MPGVRFTDIRRFDSIDSTNRYLLEVARGGAPDGVVAVADHQSAGRGRLGRRWEAPPGSNLLMSVLLRPDLPADRRHLASVVVALAATEAVQVVTDLEVGIKWPNDLLAPDGGKLAGVLAEADLAPSVGTTGRDPTAIVVGIGINVNWPGPDTVLPPELAGSTTSLCCLAGRPVDRAELLDAWLGALEPRVADLGTEPGRDRQVAEFRSRCATLGTPVRVELADDRFEGVASDVTPEGHLVVVVGDTTRTVVSGDVIHVRPAG